MEGDDLIVGKQFVQILGDVLSVPGISTKAEDQCPFLRALIRGNVDAGEFLPVLVLSDSRSAPGGHGPAARHRMHREDQM